MPLFSSRLFNGSFGDAALLLKSAQLGSSLLFDLGDLAALNPKELTKISHVFVSHTHIDHFAGFEQLLRQNLCRTSPLYLYGPKNFISQVKAKLQGFTWNLITDPGYSLEMIVTEVRPRQLWRQRFCSRHAFKPLNRVEKIPLEKGLLLDSELFSITCAVLDHGTPCLGFCLCEKERRNVESRALEVLGLQPGPWLKTMLNAIKENRPNKEPITALKVNGKEKTFELGYLRRQLVALRPERRVAYITDLVYSKSNINKVKKLVRRADLLYVEAAFTEADAHHAKAKKHLTTAQAGAVIKLCRPDKWEVFHFSHKYQKHPDRVWGEVRAAIGQKTLFEILD